jgi:hypothetical protein
MMDEEGMVDELGVGSFRDAFADLFFPASLPYKQGRNIFYYSLFN